MTFPCRVTVCRCGSTPSLSTSDKIQMLLPCRYNTRNSRSSHKTWNTKTYYMFTVTERSETATLHANMRTSHGEGNFTWSMCEILLNARSSQASCDGSARKWLTGLWRSQRSVMLLLFRRRDRLKYFISEFLFIGRRPLFGSSFQQSKKTKKQIK